MLRPIVRNSGPLGIVTQAATVEIGNKVFFEVVVAGHLVPLAALLAQPHPEPAVLRADILDRHAEGRTDAGERIDHQRNQRPVAQTGDGASVDAVEQRPRLGWIEHRLLPDVTTCRCPRSGCAGSTGTTWP